jgi:hypothetical protein
VDQREGAFAQSEQGPNYTVAGSLIYVGLLTEVRRDQYIDVFNFESA